MLTTPEQVKERIITALEDAVTIEDGNTEINEIYLEVRFLNEEFDSCGGRASEVKPWAKKRAEQFRKKLRKAVQGAFDVDNT